MEIYLIYRENKFYKGEDELNAVFEVWEMCEKWKKPTDVTETTKNAQQRANKRQIERMACPEEPGWLHQSDEPCANKHQAKPCP